MSFYKSVMYFSVADQGWSEVWYQSQDSRGDAAAVFFVFAKARRNYLGDGAAVRGVRISNVARPADSEVYYMTSSGSSLQTLKTDSPTQAIICRLFAGGDRYNRPYLVRGVPDGWIFASPTPTSLPGISADGIRGMKQLTNLINIAKLHMKAWNKDANGYAPIPIVGWGSTVGGWVQVTTKVALPAAKGDTVIINKVQRTTVDDKRALSGYKVLAVDAIDKTVVLPIRASDVPSLGDLLGGLIARREIGYFPIERGVPTFITRRKTGHLALTPKGRRSSSGS